ncbi:uncharacterized protein BDW43DRAFT_201471 [Aspergillus alliaceus]|uniref:uncharacterized protein n=1 Tax=Petromyces alliaceus TaxID=209559 RepID=UPI0012A6F2A4|nr:uncharacterized protein BDW43DRAFT_201471 [Aspergillus alliaceus]KAB8237157.1 hypothetical protein BDW43DRAFT_201471 [Aspergillus alliaceus]
MNYFIKTPAAEDSHTLRITITPHFDAQGAHHLFIDQALSSPNCLAHQPLFIFETKYGNVPAHPFTENAIQAHDAAGPLQISFTPKSDSPDQEWRVDRNTSGDVTLQFNVFPREVDITTPMGPRVDMRRDQGGLCAGGRWFLPRPAVDREYHNIVEWDLAQAPEGTRAVWSYGEGPGPVTKDGNPNVVTDSIFMVGPVKSYLNSGVLSGAYSGANIYWFGELPDNLQRLNEYNVLLFPKLASFFQREDASYRVFIRKVIRGFGGSSCLESYMLEYDKTVSEETDEDMICLLSHEMIHSFSFMDPEIDGYDNGWFIEGIAEFYSIFLPYRFGLRGVEYLQSRLNAVLHEYGTSPRIEMDATDAQHEFYNDWYAERIPYMRGCVYLLQIDSHLRKVTGRFGIDQNSPLDDILVELAKRWHRGRQVRARDWLEYLRPILGENTDIAGDFQSMLRGKVLDMRDVLVTNKDWSLSWSMQEVLEIGYDKSSNSTRIISGVVPGSRAALAGLKDGDHIVSTSRVSKCYDSLSAYYELVIERASERIHISYWPRSFTKARVWQLVQ